MIVAGFGFRRSVTRDSLEDAFSLACAGLQPDGVATVEGKAVEDVFVAFAKGHDLAMLAVTPAALAAQQTVTQSDASRAAHGTGSVAEAAALAAAGARAQLLVMRVISTDGRATCALAQGEDR